MSGLINTLYWLVGMGGTTAETPPPTTTGQEPTTTSKAQTIPLKPTPLQTGLTRGSTKAEPKPERKHATIVVEKTITVAAQGLSSRGVYYAFDPADLKASTTPTEEPLGYLPGKGTHLFFGKENSATISFKEYGIGKDVEVSIVVAKPTVTIDWEDPADLPWPGSPFTPGEAQKKATAKDEATHIRYAWDSKAGEQPGSFTITAKVADDAPYTAEPVTKTFKLLPANPMLSWKTIPKLPMPKGGVEVDDLKAYVNNPLKLDFTCGRVGGGTRLRAGEHQLVAIPKDTLRYDNAGTTTDVTVTKGELTIATSLGRQVTVKDDEPLIEVSARTLVITLTDTKDQQVKGRPLSFDPPEGSILEPGSNKIRVELAPEEKDWTARALSISVNVIYPERHKQGLRSAREVAKRAEDEALRQAKVEVPSEQQQENRRLAEDLEKLAIETGTLRSEYPYGAANKIPHIHRYGNDFHVKMVQGTKIRRFNMVQDGERYPAVEEALAAAWEYDQRTGGNLRRTLRDLLQECAPG
jgi:hypothetical protein